MSKLKPRRNRNPVYLKGFEAGYLQGFNEGKTELVDVIADALMGLRQKDGIGDKTMIQIEKGMKEILALKE